MERKYEVLLLLNPNMEDSAKATLISNIEAKIGGEIVKKEDWGIKDLAYRINKQRKAHYVLWYAETTADNIQSLKEMIAITKDIVRPMILRHEKKWPYEYKTAKELSFPAPKGIIRSNGPRGTRIGDKTAPKKESEKSEA